MTLRTLSLSVFLSVQALAGRAQVAPADSLPRPYALTPTRETVLFGTGAALGVTSLLLDRELAPLTPAQLAQLDRRTIPAFDRGATYQWSPGAARLSDVTLLTGMASVGVVALLPRARPDFIKIGVMYAEAGLLAGSTVLLVKNLAQRTRPFAYNPDADPVEKAQRDARRSFFSGHATIAFTSAAFASEVFSRYYPESRWRPVVWGGSLALATTTALLRYEAGKHFPTDLLTGAAVGSLVGWGVPKLHQRRRQHPQQAQRRLDLRPWSNGQASGIYVCWTISPTNFVQTK